MKPCKRGHTGPRYKHGQCIECAALRKGRPNRKMPPDRIKNALKAIDKAKQITKEERQARREAASLERQKLRIAEREQRIRENILAGVNLCRVKSQVATAIKEKAKTSLNIQVQAPEPAKPEYLTQRKVDSTGHVTETLILGRDGKPILANPTTKAREQTTPEPERVLTRVEELRERYVRHHSGEQVPAPRGFCDPGGVVSFNAAREGGVDARTRKLRLLDF